MNDDSKIPRWQPCTNPPPSPRFVISTNLSRRAFLGTGGLSLGSVALSSLMARPSWATAGGGSQLALGEDTPTYKLGSGKRHSASS